MITFYNICLALNYGGVQKNIGPSGMAIVIVREDLIGHAGKACPTMFDFKVRRCRLTLSKPVLNAPVVSALEATI